MTVVDWDSRVVADREETWREEAWGVEMLEEPRLLSGGGGIGV